MDSQCETIRRWVVEAGSSAGLAEEHARHLTSCQACRRFVASEENLLQMFERAAVPSDPDLETAIIAEIGRKTLWRRRLALVPPFASLVMVCLGIASLGEFPGASALATVSRWSGGGWVVLARSVADFGIALAAAARGFSTLIAWPTAVIAAVVSGACVAAVGALIVRWRPRRRWPVRF